MSYIMTKDLIAKEVWRICAAHLHKEWLDWRTLELAALTAYIDTFYSPHSHSGGVSPEQFEKAHARLWRWGVH